MKNLNITGLVLSAGKSGRMGKFKPLLAYKGESFIKTIVDKLDPLCPQIIIVTGYKSEELMEKLISSLKEEEKFKLTEKIKFVHNESYEKGMFTSLQKGLSAAKECDWLLYHFVDQPGLPVKFYSELILQIDEEHNWVQPSNNGRSGHPILLHKELFPKFLTAPSNSNLREISHSAIVKKKYWECSYKEIFQDIDTEEDYLLSL